MNEGNGDKVLITPNDVVKVTKMNHIIEVQHMEKMNRKNNIKKLDKDRFVDISTGEIREFEHTENRQQGYNSLRQTFKKLRYLINNNFIGNPNELHITLTYKENMTDTKRLYTDFKNFIERLRTSYKNKSSLDYLCVVEPQGRGAWHCHVLMRFNDLDKVYIKNADLKRLWGLGFVTIKSLKDVDNIGAYLSAYLTDIDLDDVNDKETAFKVASEGCEIKTKVVDGKEKKFIKGGRLHMYPPGMNMYRKSKGIIKPEREEMKFKDIKKVVGSATPHYQKSYHIENDDFENTISFLQYNTKRDS
ncbi:hypothetical protein [Nocardia sp. NPDC019309]|uniref:rolling circle replication-associated protein n=1 Tax=Nocardia sp. NPDC019309 TaxID=3154785 RepID=UPI0033FAA02A|nr:hypothetical protein [Escherichia coli]